MTSPESHREQAAATGQAHADFRHSYSKDKAQLARRLSRIEGQVRGIARMIEREEYCVDILQQTAALRAAVDALAILVLEDHVQGCVRTAAERGEADVYVEEVLDVVRRTLGARSGGVRERPDGAAHGRSFEPPTLLPGQAERRRVIHRSVDDSQIRG